MLYLYNKIAFYITLTLIYKHSDKLKKAHSYVLKLTNIFNTHCGRKSGMAKLNRWIKKVEKSAVTCFDVFNTTLTSSITLKSEKIAVLLRE